MIAIEISQKLCTGCSEKLFNHRLTELTQVWEKRCQGLKRCFCFALFLHNCRLHHLKLYVRQGRGYTPFYEAYCLLLFFAFFCLLPELWKLPRVTLLLLLQSRATFAVLTLLNFLMTSKISLVLITNSAKNSKSLLLHCRQPPPPPSPIFWQLLLIGFSLQSRAWIQLNTYLG